MKALPLLLLLLASGCGTDWKDEALTARANLAMRDSECALLREDVWEWKARADSLRRACVPLRTIVLRGAIPLIGGGIAAEDTIIYVQWWSGGSWRSERIR